MRRDLIIEAAGVRKTYTTGAVKAEARRGVDIAVTRALRNGLEEEGHAVTYRAGRGARLSRRHALFLGAVLWVGLFGLEVVVLPPWDMRGRAGPATPAPMLRRPGNPPACPAPRLSPETTRLSLTCPGLANTMGPRR